MMKQDIVVHIVTDQLSFFDQLFVQGIMGSAISGASIYDFLANEMGITPEYITHRIQTIFLDGKAVDDVQKTLLQQNSTLALSAAMPGLVGATFRKSGFYSGLRKNISYEPQSAVSHEQKITFTLKLFNTIAKELGPGLLKKGVLIKGSSFQDFILCHQERFPTVCKKEMINEMDLKVEDFLSYEWKNKTVYLIITEKQ